MAKNKLRIEDDEDAAPRSVIPAQVGWKVIRIGDREHLSKVFESIVEANERTEAKLPPPKVPDPPVVNAGVLEAVAPKKAIEPKWTPYLEKCAALKVGKSIFFDAPDDKFQSGLRQILAGSKWTMYSRWLVRQKNGKIEVCNNGPWAHVDEASQETALPEAAQEASPAQEIPANFEVFDGPTCKCGKPVHRGRCKGEGGSTGRNSARIESIKAEIIKAIMAGGSLRKVSKQFRVATQTVLGIRKTLDMSELKCECGRPIGHRGWCKGRVQKSQARQETVKALVASKGKAESKYATELVTREVVIEQVAAGIEATVERMARQDNTKAIAAPPVSLTYIPDDPPEAKLLMEEALAYHVVNIRDHGKYSDEDWNNWEQANERFNGDKVSALAQRILDHRKAKEIADRHLNEYAAKDGSTISLAREFWDKGLGELWSAVHAAVLEAIVTSRPVPEKNK